MLVPFSSLSFYSDEVIVLEFVKLPRHLHVQEKHFESTVHLCYRSLHLGLIQAFR